VLLGALVIVVVCLAFLNPRLRHLESELPDAASAPGAPGAPGGDRGPQPVLAPTPEGA
jgi:hypothetical protein